MRFFKFFLFFLLISGLMTSNVLSQTISICISKHDLNDNLYKKVKNDENCHSHSTEKKTLQFCFTCDCDLIQIQKFEYMMFLISENFTSHLNKFLEKFNSLNLISEDPPPRFFS